MIFDPFRKSQQRSIGWQQGGNQYDRRIRVLPRPKASPGASGRSTIQRDPRGGTTITQQREQDQAIEAWIQTLNEKDRAFAESSGIGKPLADAERQRLTGELPEEESGHQPSTPSAAGSHNGRPLHHGESPVIDFLEPRRAVAIEELSEGQIAEAHAGFANALAWVHESAHLVKRGRRMAALVAWTRPDLSESLPAAPGLLQDLRRRLDVDVALLTLVFYRVWRFVRDGATVSGLGIRADIIAYVVRPELLDAATNHQIGAQLNNTRAAINKLVGEFRDTFAGIRAPAMRPESTRQACREAQLQ